MTPIPVHATNCVSFVLITYLFSVIDDVTLLASTPQILIILVIETSMINRKSSLAIPQRPANSNSQSLVPLPLHKGYCLCSKSRLALARMGSYLLLLLEDYVTALALLSLVIYPTSLA